MPSVKNLPLSSERVKSVLAEIFESFEKNAIGRQLLAPVRVRPEQNGQEQFARIGVSHIVDKIWFVEAVFGDTSYGYQGIGGEYGRGLADAETKLIVDTIIESCKNNTLTFHEEILPSAVLRGVESLGMKGMEPRIIITSIDHNLQLWRHRNMVTRGQLCIAPSFSGLTTNIDIISSRVVPDGVSIIVDPRRIGYLLVKEPVEDVAQISEIAAEERAKLLSELKDFTADKLDESVKLLVYETVKPKVIEPNAAVVINTKENSNQFLFVK